MRSYLPSELAKIARSARCGLSRRRGRCSENYCRTSTSLLLGGRMRWNALKHHETFRYCVRRGSMSLMIDGIRYYSAAEIARTLGISRSTFWRWRALSEENLPTGRRYRSGKMVLFTEEEAQALRGFANRLEPVQRTSRDQMKLFNGAR
jgi:predicted DNA-binding transcriptional regulator AlpA